MDVEHTCRSKQVYLSKAEAKRVAREMSRRHREALHLYSCPHCGYHHVGHVVPAYVRAWTSTRSRVGDRMDSAIIYRIATGSRDRDQDKAGPMRDSFR